MMLLMVVLPWASGCDATPSAGETPGSGVVLGPGQLTQRGSITFVRGWDLGRRYAADRRMPCLAFFTAPWCTYCHRMEETTFCDREVVKLAEQFVCVLVDADAEADLCRRLQISGFPTLELVSPAGVSLGRLTGWQSAPQLIHSLQAALHRYAWLEERTINR